MEVKLWTFRRLKLSIIIQFIIFVMLLFTLDTNFEASDYNITMQQPSDNVRLKIQVLDIKNGMYVLFDIVFSWFDVFFF